MIRDEDYEMCKKCPYYFGEINWCMVGEPDVVYDEAKAECKKSSISKRINSIGVRVAKGFRDAVETNECIVVEPDIAYDEAKAECRKDES